MMAIPTTNFNVVKAYSCNSSSSTSAHTSSSTHVTGTTGSCSSSSSSSTKATLAIAGTTGGTPNISLDANTHYPAPSGASSSSSGGSQSSRCSSSSSCDFFLQASQTCNKQCKGAQDAALLCNPMHALGPSGNDFVPRHFIARPRPVLTQGPPPAFRGLPVVFPGSHFALSIWPARNLSFARADAIPG